MVFSASPDSTIRVWSVAGGNCVQVVRAHEGGVTGLSLHATGDYLLSSSEDQVCVRLGDKKHRLRAIVNTEVYVMSTTLNVFPIYFLTVLQYWAFSDIQTGRVLTKVTDESAGCGK